MSKAITAQPWLFDDDQPDSIRLMNLYDLIRHEYFGPGDEVATPEAEPKAYFRASRIGYCLRSQCLQRAGVKPTRVEDEGDRARMQAGHEHEWLYRLKWDHAGFLIQTQIRLADPELGVEGHIDLLRGGEIQDLPDRAFFWNPDFKGWVERLRGEALRVTGGELPVEAEEVKSTGQWAFRSIPPTGRSYHMLQAGLYRKLADLHPDAFLRQPESWAVILINRENRRYRTIEVTDAWRDTAEARLGTLLEAWKSGSWPNCTCGKTEDMTWEAELCNYISPDGDACCDQTLLQRLEASLEGVSS